MRLFSNPGDCCGCTACRSVCPRNAISMRPDDKGFLYPQIDSARCVECGLCRAVCPMRAGFSTGENLPEPAVYAVKHRSGEVRMQSSSGGMFTAVSDYVLGQGGTVYGAAFNADFSVSHRRAETARERDLFRGSKYVQSDPGDAFRNVKDDLKSGRPVLFSGTPCQTAGLFSYLKKSRADMEKLVLCDLICHGTPSPLVFQQYLKHLERKYDSAVASVLFRCKALGWRSTPLSVRFLNRHEISDSDRWYSKLYGRGLITRDSCYACPFANLKRPSDLTIGDFWGIENAMPDFEDEKGVSLVLVNTEKGERVFDAIQDSLICRPGSTKDCLQPNLRHPSVPSPKRDAFWADYQRRGFGHAAKKYADAGVKGHVKTAVKKALKRLGLRPS